MGKVALYKLDKRNISFDFYAWQIHAWILGYRETVFQISNGYGNRNQPADVLERRYRSIIRPGPAMLGLPSREGDDGEECADHKLHWIIKDGAASGYNFPRFRSIKPPGTARHTITIRNVPVHLERNSGPVWREFAKLIGARVIEDWHDEPIDLYDRMALYAGARMNWGVSNGPMGLCYLTPYPCQLWNCGHPRLIHAWEKHGIKKGMQIPFMLPGQSLRWDEPTLPKLMEAYEKVEAECSTS